MNIDPISIAPLAPANGAAPAAAPAVHAVAEFERAWQQARFEGPAAAPAAPVAASEPAFTGVVAAFQRLDDGMRQMGERAFGVDLATADLTPGQILDMTAKAHQFLFTCELTSNVANRSAEGLQQLFRQQS